MFEGSMLFLSFLLSLPLLIPYSYVLYIKASEIEVAMKSRLQLSTDKKYEDNGDQDCIYVDYKKILDTCSVGDFVYIDDGLISLKVTGKDSTCLFTGGY